MIVALSIIQGNTQPGSAIHEAASGALILISTQFFDAKKSCAGAIGNVPLPKRDDETNVSEDHEQAIYVLKVKEELGKLGFEVVEKNTGKVI